MDRTKAHAAEQKLKYPKSPAFTAPKAKHKKDLKVKPVLDYCTQKNIPFKLEEDLYYKINKLAQMHNKFEINVNKCFETQRPSENERGIELL
jgi:hypothetical protein